LLVAVEVQRDQLLIAKVVAEDLGIFPQQEEMGVQELLF
jgi:hypothetical protein